MELTSCPECGAAADVVWRFCEEGTDGPVEHVKLQCINRHWFLGASAALLARPRRSAAPTAGAIGAIE